MESTQAILIRRIRFGDNSLILSWLTADFGKLKTIAKGALTPKSPFFGKLDLFFLCELGFSRAKSGEIHGTREVRMISAFSGIRTGYTRTLAAGYFAELADLASEPEHANPVVFDLVQRALKFLDANEPTARAVHFFETQVCLHVETETGHEVSVQGVSRLRALLGKVPENREQLFERLEDKKLGG